MITPENIVRHEFIGLETSIVESDNLQVVGMHGKIIDETKSMFTIETQTGVKNMAKENSVWRFVLDGISTTVNGKAITKRSYERMGVKS